MTFPEAKVEFAVRYYLWATSEFEREINESFPGFHSFKSGAVWKTKRFMQQLSKPQQLTLASGLLKRFHPEATKHLNEICSRDEESLRTRRDNFFRIRSLYNSVRYCRSHGMIEEADYLFKSLHDDLVLIVGDTGWNDDKSLSFLADHTFDAIPALFEDEIEARKKAGEKIRFANKRKIQSMMKARFEAVFDSSSFGPPQAIDDEDLAFYMECKGWIIRTHFWFGRQASLLNYSHSIASAEAVAQHGNQTQLKVLASNISFTAWLGISNQIEWNYLLDSEVAPVCDVAIQFFQKFFGIAPKLLKGLEPDQLAAR